MEALIETPADGKKIAQEFATALQNMADYWRDNALNPDVVADYLQNDLKRFPQIIKEDMQNRGAKVS